MRYGAGVKEVEVGRRDEWTGKVMSWKVRWKEGTDKEGRGEESVYTKHVVVAVIEQLFIPEIFTPFAGEKLLPNLKNLKE